LLGLLEFVLGRDSGEEALERTVSREGPHSSSVVVAVSSFSTNSAGQSYPKQHLNFEDHSVHQTFFDFEFVFADRKNLFSVQKIALIEKNFPFIFSSLRRNRRFSIELSDLSE
jgi:hypothetical protein